MMDTRSTFELKICGVDGYMIFLGVQQELPSALQAVAVNLIIAPSEPLKNLMDI